MSRIRVMLVEDDPFWQQNLSSDLAEELDIEVVAVVSTRESAVDTALRESIDIILMDINLTGNNLDGLDAMKEIFSRIDTDTVKVIMLTSLTEREIIMKSFQIGALNYITKQSYKDIVRAIREAYQDRSTIHADAARIMRSEIQLMELSPMEREVFELRKEGLSKQQISDKLHKSTNTIKSQLKSIKNKLTHFRGD
ncbi:DNA-binding NarL/FixJ family response regulator [Paenibacillus endophyticus]|uniref:DNA-binding NarL/FixJ family response regulator n=1 Tax=Paenibacillus endophyticus TaxID=1294268 RepID=A0A7W5CA03_9BACL|nr:response regulator transcription factor [Paenibacillus endophyticus]MBB3153757.1 DNA-binding NarL/FixJ family response regulator [Paenibacillus endophyticus]